MKHVNAGVNIDNSHFYKKTILILWVEKWLKTPLLNDPECCKANTDVLQSRPFGTSVSYVMKLLFKRKKNVNAL